MWESVGPLEWAAKVAFYLVALATLSGACVAVYARNLFRAALGLALALFGVAVLYLYLEAEFLAVVQLLVYVGAILTLIIFGVMLTTRIADPRLPRWNQQAGAALGIALFLGVGMAWLFWNSGPFWEPAGGAVAPVPLSALGKTLLSSYLLPFEVLSVLLLGSLAGAIFIARKEK